MCQCVSLTWDVEHTEEGEQPRPGRAQQPRQVAGQVQAGRREGRGHSAGLVSFLIKEEMERSVVSQPLTFSAVQTWPTGHVIGMYQPRSVDPIAVTSWWNIVSYLSRSLHLELWLEICGKYVSMTKFNKYNISKRFYILRIINLEAVNGNYEV